MNQIDEENVSIVITRLKNKFSYGLDGISNSLIKNSSDVINKPLTLIINQTLTSGIFPGKQKSSKVIPIFKSGEVSCISNYRPISLLTPLLLGKLWHYGIRATEIQLRNNYLSNRYQLTEVNGYKSKPLKIKTGVPQGSVLGSFLFLLYINDLPNCSDFLMVMYDDDTTLYCNIDSGHTSSTIINDELKK